MLEIEKEMRARKTHIERRLAEGGVEQLERTEKRATRGREAILCTFEDLSQDCHNYKSD